jgi:prevent-host-death family protein
MSLTRDTILLVSNPEVSIRDLRNHGGEVIDRVMAGEKLTVTRSGRPVAELRPLAAARLKASVILEHWSRLPRIDPNRLREQLDDAVSPSL